MNDTLLTEYIIDANIVDRGRLSLAGSAYADIPLVKALENLGVITEAHLCEKLADFLGVEFIDLNTTIPSLHAVKMIMPKVLTKRMIVPLSVTHDRFEIATSCPGDWNVIDELAFVTDRQIVEKLAKLSQIEEMLADLLGDEMNVGKDSSGDVLITDESELKERLSPQDYLEFDEMEQKNAAVKIVNRLIKNAMYRNVSDMHIEPTKNKLVIRVRIDGELSILSELPIEFTDSVVSRVKVSCDMDITMVDRPQDGSMTVQTKNMIYNVRVSSVPTPFGEKLVLRFLNPSASKVKLEDLGFFPLIKDKLSKLGRMPQGLIIITGPTGSGKNTSMCSIINSVKSVVSNIVSVEDPIEYDIEGVNQIAINNARGMTFPVVLRALLRQDPNVIYVGEVRDEETAQICCRAAQTGHLVFTTLHTNDAPSAVRRLIDMNIDPFSIAESLTAVLAQRLARRVCPDCLEKVEPTEDELEKLAPLIEAEMPINLTKGRGCSACNQSGFKGRISVTELMVIDEDLKSMIIGDSSAAELMTKAVANGMATMWDTGLMLAAAGITTIEEIARHIPEPLVAAARKGDFPELILAVDDDPGILRLCERVFTKIGTKIVTASDGDYALERIKDYKPDFVITDLNMPRVDGYALCRRIREDPATQQLPIIVVTGRGDTREAEITCLDIGVNDFIRKPLDPEALVARIRAAYQRHLASVR